MNFFKPFQNIHLIGIGGIGVSAIAEVLIRQGKTISGSDLKASAITRHLELLGANIYSGHNSSQVEGKDLVIYSTAVDETNPEMKYALEHKIPIVTRAEALGHIMKEYPYSIAVSGTHGKTTTTSMIATIFNSAGLDPTVLVGGELESIGGNTLLGKGKHLITEACEYKDSFLSFQPNCAIILNIEEDHLDYFKDLEDIVDSFTSFAQKIPKNGHLILNHDDYPTMRLINHVNCHVVTFGFHEEATFSARHVRFDENGNACFELFHGDKSLCTIGLRIPGKHNVLNALAAIATAHTLGVSTEEIAKALLSFVNAKRRFEIIGVKKGITLIDDYAHHPNEVKATLNAAANYPHKRIIGVFQPHTYTRTRELLDEFSRAFGGCDHLILADIYAAREVDLGQIHTQDLARLIEAQNLSVTYLPTFDAIVDYLKVFLRPDDLLICMGAGNINEVAFRLNENL